MKKIKAFSAYIGKGVYDLLREIFKDFTLKKLAEVLLKLFIFILGILSTFSTIQFLLFRSMMSTLVYLFLVLLFSFTTLVMYYLLHRIRGNNHQDF